MAGVFVITSFLWLVVGYERIVVSPSKLTVSRHTPIWKRQVECALQNVKNLRSESLDTNPFGNRLPNWYSRKTGQIQLDYGVHSIGFGIELDAAEAKQVVERILSAFPDLGPSQ
ncbi:hypothetical protein [uncultured Roseobacter sp.]|uniref:hypothetical protein n=1 Tax=uncultured Roseobacter sp. TaxID=114847 RepID=UPI0026061787|nr:hypothetical protein [uncultured Roseobacter sp.]